LDLNPFHSQTPTLLHNQGIPTMNPRPRILFLCTGNACRSQMAEAILRHLDPVRFEALSAGSSPAGFIHPLATEALEDLGIPVVEQRSKSWLEFRDQPPDVLITVCDSAAGEVCPAWPGRPPTAHWPLPDPVMHSGPDSERRTRARAVAQTLLDRLKRMIDLDWANLDASGIRDQLDHIART